MKSQSLSWFPMDADEWINRMTFLSLEESGALLKACLVSWNASIRGEEPGTLPASDEALARLLGPTWKRVKAIVLEQFVEHPDDPTRRRCEWLASLYATQMQKHLSFVERAKKGGWKKGRPRGPRAKADTSAIPEVLHKPSEGDPVGGSKGAPTTGGVDTVAGRGVATTAPTPDARTSPDPVPVSSEDVFAWADHQPELRWEIEQSVEARLDEGNKGWRDRVNGAALRNRLVEAKLAEAFVRERRRGTIPPFALTSSASHLSQPGAAHA